MTPREWNHVLDHKVEWSIAYPAVARAVRDYLFGPSQSCVAYPGMTTNELVEQLYPEAAARGDGIYARRRIFTALDALREHELADWCHQEEPTRARFGKMIRRVRWHQPQAVTEVEEVQTPEPSPAGGVLDDFERKFSDPVTLARRILAAVPDTYTDEQLADIGGRARHWVMDALRNHVATQA